MTKDKWTKDQWITALRMAVIASVPLASLFATALGAQAQPGEAPPFDLRVFPSQLNRNEVYRLELWTSRPNMTFNLEITGRSGFYLQQQESTDPYGRWAKQFNAWYDVGQYEIRATGTSANDTASVTLTIGCDARCQIDILNAWGLYSASAQADIATRYGIIAILVIVGLELPRGVAFLVRQARDAKRSGRLTAKEMAIAPIVIWRGFVQPGSQAVRPDVNPAIALDLERRELMERLHDATSPRFMGWSPGHIEHLRSIFADLRAAWKREAQAQVPSPPPWQPEYERRPVDRAAIERQAQLQLMMMKEKSLMEKLDRFDDEAARAMVRTRARKDYIIAWLSFGLGGIPATLMVALMALAEFGVYVDIFRPLWQPWPPDWVKYLLGSTISAGATLDLVTAYARVRKARRRKGAA